MKTQNRILVSKFAMLAILATGGLVVTSCNKEKVSMEQEGEVGEGTRVVVRVAGINNSGDGEVKTKGSTKTKSAGDFRKVEDTENSGFDAFIGVDNNVESENSIALAKKGIKSSSIGSRAEAMPQNATYKLFLYKKVGANLVAAGAQQFTTNAPGTLAVEKGQEYEWYALSYNNTDDISSVTPDGTDLIQLDGNKDALYTKGTFIVPNTPGDVAVPLNITFDHKFARIAIELNTMGMFGPIQTGTNLTTVAVTGLDPQKAKINIKTGELSALSSANVSLNNIADYVDANGFGDKRVAYVYTASTAAHNVTVNVNNLTVKLDNNANRTFTGTRPFNFTFTPGPNKNLRVLVAAMESPLVHGGVSWARSNLYYNGPDNPTPATMTHNPYRFFHTNPQTPNDVNNASTKASFFAFKAHLPRTFASNDVNSQKDPCALVYPAGRWKTPSETDLGSLTNTSGLLGNVLGSLTSGLGLSATPDASFVAGQYIEYDNFRKDIFGNPTSTQLTTGQNAAYGANTSATNTLRFPYNGTMVNLAAVNSLITLNLGSTHGSNAAFWSSQNISNTTLGGVLGGVIDLGAWSWSGRNAKILLGLLGESAFTAKSAGVLNIGLLGAVNVIQSPFMNVRCVRNSAWNPNASGYVPEPNLNNL